MQPREFPRNANGQTFGSSSPPTPPRSATAAQAVPFDFDSVPDLILTFGNNGALGYVTKADMFEPGPNSPEEAAALTPTSRTIPLYAEDGETVIGDFTISAGNPS